MKLESWQSQLALMIGVFALATALAALLGANSLGIALTFGQMAFAATFMYLIWKR